MFLACFEQFFIFIVYTFTLIDVHALSNNRYYIVGLLGVFFMWKEVGESWISLRFVVKEMDYYGRFYVF